MRQCDEAGSFRYSLTWETSYPCCRRLTVIQLNPSTAGSQQSDPTVGKVLAWSKENGFGAVTFTNLFALREPQPSRLLGKSYEQLCGPRNDISIKASIQRQTVIVLAWGDLTGVISLSQYRLRLAMLSRLFGRTTVHCVGELVESKFSKVGQRCRFPRHGRMWNTPHRYLHQVAWNQLQVS